MILFPLFFSSRRKMKWGLGQSPKRVDNQSVAIDKIFTSNSCCFVKCNHSFKISFGKILGEDKSGTWPGNSFRVLCHRFTLERSVSPNYYLGEEKKLNVITFLLHLLFKVTLFISVFLDNKKGLCHQNRTLYLFSIF